MDDKNRNPFDFNEINKIQAEIDQDLKKHLDNGLSGINQQVKSEPSAVNEQEIHLENLNQEEVQKSLSSNDINTEQEQTQVPPVMGGTEGTRIVPEAEPQPELGTCSSNFDNKFLNETIKHQSNNSKFKKTIAVALIVSIAGGFSIGAGFSAGSLLFGNNQPQVEESEEEPFSFSDKAEAASETQQPQATLPVQNVDTFNYADIIDKVEPSVVSITKLSTYTNNGIGFFNMPSQSYEVPSSGSGIIFDEDDEKVYIVTNYHVIEEATSIGVSVEQNAEVEAAVLGTSPESDLAVLFIYKTDLIEQGVHSVVVADFADSDTMRAGDFVIAIGNALGEGNTSTFGMVSAINKEINVEDRVLSVIQTDAAINPGNSGGPLINLKGQVIGINTVKLVESSVEGMGYSITSNMAKPIIEDLRNQVQKPFLGVAGYDVDERIAQIYDLPQMGIIVESVIEDSSADAAGIKRGDIITSFNGMPVYDFSQLSEEIQNCAVGDVVEIKLLREGKDQMTISVTLIERPASY